MTVKRQKYVVQMLDGRHWIATRWANPDGQSSPRDPVMPTGKRKAEAAIKCAQHFYPKHKYRIHPV